MPFMAVHFDLEPFEDRLLGDGVLALLRTLREFEESAQSRLERQVIAAVAEAVRLDSVFLERCRETHRTLVRTPGHELSGTPPSFPCPKLSPSKLSR